MHDVTKYISSLNRISHTHTFIQSILCLFFILLMPNKKLFFLSFTANAGNSFKVSTTLININNNNNNNNNNTNRDKLTWHVVAMLWRYCVQLHAAKVKNQSSSENTASDHQQDSSYSRFSSQRARRAGDPVTTVCNKKWYVIWRITKN